MADMDSLNAALSFWDVVAYATLSAVFVGVVGESILEFTSWVPVANRGKIGKASALILIAGLGGEIITHAKNSEYTGKITSLLNDQAGNAHERASRADERSVALQHEVERLRAENFNAAAKLVELQARQNEQGTQVTTVETKVVTVESRVGNVETKVGTVETKLRPREIDIARLKSAMQRVKRRYRNVTFVRTGDVESRRYADQMAAVLRKLHFKVNFEDVGFTSDVGVAICENNAKDMKIAEAFRRGGLDVTIVKNKASTRPGYCDYAPNASQPPSGVFAFVGGAADTILTGSIGATHRGTVVFVGPKP